MNAENFIVRGHLKQVERFQQAAAWDWLSEADVQEIEQHVAGLPSQIATDEIEARHFDHSALRLQIALVENDRGPFESLRRRVVEIAALLEEKDAVPAVKAQLNYLRLVQTSEFWEGVDLAGLEQLRVRLRGLVQFIDKAKRKIVYTNFKDELIPREEELLLALPKMTGAQYAKKVDDYLRGHRDDLVIQRLRQNQPLTATDLKSLETTLVQIGENDGARLLGTLIEQRETPSLAHFVRRMVGMDRSTAQAAFSGFIDDRSLSALQIRFVETVIDQLTVRGYMEASALYEPPFSDLHDGGPEALFADKANVIDAVFQALAETLPRVLEA